MTGAQASGGEIASGTTTQLAQLIELVITRIPLWIAAAIVIALSIFVAKISRNIVENKLAEKGLEEEHKELQILGGRMVYSGILILGITVGLNIAGIDLTTIIAAVAFGIGFALKDLIMNFLAGVMILVGGHFSIGDFISIGGTIGKIVEIQSRVTIMKAIDGTKVVVPNAELFTKQVTSFTSNPFRRIEVLVGVDYRTNLEKATKVCLGALKSTKGVLLEPAPAVVVSDFNDSSIDIKVRGWVDSKGGWIKIRSDLVMRIKEEFDKNGIKIPWPIRTIAYDKDSEEIEKMIEEEYKEKPENKEKPQEKVEQTERLTEKVQAENMPKESQHTPEDSPDEDQPLKPLAERI
jgi:small conductance mechanosensitive channel